MERLQPGHGASCDAMKIRKYYKSCQGRGTAAASHRAVHGAAASWCPQGGPRALCPPSPFGVRADLGSWQQGTALPLPPGVSLGPAPPAPPQLLGFWGLRLAALAPLGACVSAQLGFPL